MQKFDYRTPRFTVDFPIQFTGKDLTSAGRCKEISKDGMTLELSKPLPPDAAGTISMTHQGRALEIEVRVAHSGATQGGVEFVYRSESERRAIEQLVEAVASFQPRLASVRLK